MSIDRLQERIRKTKNPSVLQLDICPSDIPRPILEASSSVSMAVGYFCKELILELKGIIRRLPGKRIQFK